MKEKVVVLLAISAFILIAQTKIVGCFIFPHGDIALDPSRYEKLFNSSQMSKAWRLNSCALQAGQIARDLHPDAIFVDSPHAIADYNVVSFFLNAKGNGDVETEGEPKGKWNMSVNFESNLALDTMKSLSKTLGHGFVSGITAFSQDPDEYFPLKWGEIIPLQFLLMSKEKIQSSIPVVIMSQPTRRMTEAVEMIPQMEIIGNSLWRYLDSRNERIIFVISGDLAHTHDPQGPYGYSDAAQPFDDAISEWATSLNRTLLVETAASYAPKALSCGFTGFALLQGLLNGGDSSVKWKSSVCVCNAPSYYGMMISSFSRLWKHI